MEEMGNTTSRISEKYPCIYDELIDKLGEGSWRVLVGGVSHYVSVENLIAGTINLRVSLSGEGDKRFVDILSGSQTLSRSPREYAETVLKSLCPIVQGPSPGKQSEALGALVKIERLLGRPLAPKVFLELFKIVSNTHNGLKTYDNLSTVGVFEIVHDNVQIVFTIGREEKDSEILGRILCGVRFFNKQPRPEREIAE